MATESVPTSPPHSGAGTYSGGGGRGRCRAPIVNGAPSKTSNLLPLSSSESPTTSSLNGLCHRETLTTTTTTTFRSPAYTINNNNNNNNNIIKKSTSTKESCGVGKKIRHDNNNNNCKIINSHLSDISCNTSNNNNNNNNNNRNEINSNIEKNNGYGTVLGCNLLSSPYGKLWAKNNEKKMDSNSGKQTRDAIKSDDYGEQEKEEQRFASVCNDTIANKLGHNHQSTTSTNASSRVATVVGRRKKIPSGGGGGRQCSGGSMVYGGGRRWNGGVVLLLSLVMCLLLGLDIRIPTANAAG